ncbi:class I SAM-dependent methyltransferase [Candidatus Woesearchaeota archaeon]|jgi:2-polyprenyl-3-methyl-5-hydroxy-6-metoxy-1,4-benzoquinol methylase|nr:class I SAM-dependent methyltransferase [Candidatus Woesearchaeota archaeon]MBT5397246.1 class I SAM-dependent methyltransferase [Candidatus Woesearchaeota archaeon]MBT5924297.1 class I SAM-dependent methyltransferase [Candidatus Woesearchaeota archaeon]MBT6367208.1 class I SAM-dependent methyltransferase [Candidatus Woesearchaeota archaeon]MBT7762646.1 class I SAM-dependent methyltransferase [Candidatus Woesearchaeota archaeon]
MDDINYDHIEKMEAHNWWYKGKRDIFDNILSKKKKKFTSALDIGCGVGSHLGVLKKHAENVEGIDFSAKAVSYCKAKGWNTVSKGDVCNLSRNTKYDVVLCSELLEHVDDVKAVTEISSVMTKGGVFIFSVPAHSYLWNDNDILSHHKRRYEKKRLRKLLEKDFTIRRLSYWNSVLFLPTWLFYKFKRKGTMTNNLNLVPKGLNGLLYKILKFENMLFHKIMMPQGITLIGVCTKK